MLLYQLLKYQIDLIKLSKTTGQKNLKIMSVVNNYAYIQRSFDSVCHMQK